jgi:Na+/H+ antiporter NhaD/arsenite permease-like protein
MLVHGGQSTGVIDWLAGQLMQATQGNLILTASVVLWSAAILSAIIGASANLTVAGIAERAGISFSFMRYTRDGLPLTLLSVLIAQAYLLLRY